MKKPSLFSKKKDETASNPPPPPATQASRSKDLLKAQEEIQRQQQAQAEAEANTKKPSPFASLKKKSSRIFKRAPSPPPPLPTRPVISNPISINPHTTAYTTTTTSPRSHIYIPPSPAPEFKRPIAPAPARPDRPDSLDPDIIDFMKDTTARTALGTSPRNAVPADIAPGREIEDASQVAREGGWELIQRVQPRKRSGGGWIKGGNMYVDQQGFRHFIEDL